MIGDLQWHFKTIINTKMIIHRAKDVAILTCIKYTKILEENYLSKYLQAYDKRWFQIWSEMYVILLNCTHKSILENKN